MKLSIKYLYYSLCAAAVPHVRYACFFPSVRPYGPNGFGNLLGVYAYQLAVEPNPAHPEDYDAFYEAISAPVPSHKITMPYGQGTMEFDAEILSGEDRLLGKMAGVNRWTGMVVDFQPLSLQRKPT